MNKPLDKNIDLKIKKGTILTDDLLETISDTSLQKITIDDKDSMFVVEKLLKEFKESIQKIEKKFAEDAVKIKECDELPQGTLKNFHIFLGI